MQHTIMCSLQIFQNLALSYMVPSAAYLLI